MMNGERQEPRKECSELETEKGAQFRNLSSASQAHPQFSMRSASNIKIIGRSTGTRI